MKKTAVVFGAGGFIGNHLVRRLKNHPSIEYKVIGFDLVKPEFNESAADEFIQLDLRDPANVSFAFTRFSPDELYQLAADMGGAEYIFTGANDANIMHNSAMINLNVCHELIAHPYCKVFYSSSACVYPEFLQDEVSDVIPLRENLCYPAQPDSEYGWEKIFAERLYLAHARNYGLNVRIARFHNIFGPQCKYQGGKEKAPAAICRKVATEGVFIEIFGDGEQMRTFLYVDECIDGIFALMDSECREVVNIGSEEIISINDLTKMVFNFYPEGGSRIIKHIPGPTGVRCRTSENSFIFGKIRWKPTAQLIDGMKKTFTWINQQING